MMGWLNSLQHDVLIMPIIFIEAWRNHISRKVPYIQCIALMSLRKLKLRELLVLSVYSI